MTNPLANVRAVLFDAVGTLIRPHPPVVDVYYEAGRQFGSALTRREVAARFVKALRRAQRRDLPLQVAAAVGNATPTPRASSSSARAPRRFRRRPTNERKERQRWRKIVSDVFGDSSAAKGPLFEHLWQHFAESRHWALYDDVADVWPRLKQRVPVVGVASNFDCRLAQVCRGLAPLSRCRHVYTSSSVGWPKPSPRFFRAIASRLDLLPEQILLVGNDRVNDYLGARSAGWQALYLDREGKSPCKGKSERDGKSARGTISRLDALLEVLAP